jgi:hypothetical protein
MIDDCLDTISEYNNKLRFLEEIKEGKLHIMDRPKKELVKELEDRKYDMRLEKKAKRKNNEDDEEVEKKEEKMSYAYLLKTSIIGLTKEKLIKLREEIEKMKKKLEELKLLDTKKMWVEELDKFVKCYRVWERDMAKRDKDRSKKREKKNTKK